MQFEAFAAEAGFDLALVNGFKRTLPATQSAVLSDGDATEKAQKEARSMNAKAINQLTLAIQSAPMLNKIHLSKTTALLKLFPLNHKLSRP